MYEKYIFYEYLLSPINGYKSRNLISNKKTIEKFGFNSVEDLHSRFPGFPLECQSTKDIKSKISQSRSKKTCLSNTDKIPDLDYFQDTRFKTLYKNIISNAVIKNHGKTGYFEVHHIIPKSFGGSDNWNNMVRLTAREHFLCHYLLTKMVDEDTKDYHLMCHAFNMMGSSSDEQPRYMNSRLFESSRIGFSQRMSDLQTGDGNSQYETIWICNFATKENKKIKKTELEKYLNSGWVKKRVFNFTKFDENGNVIKKKSENKKVRKIKPKKEHIKMFKLSVYRRSNNLPDPSNNILNYKSIRMMTNTITKIGFNYDAENLDNELIRIIKQLDKDVNIDKIPLTSLCGKYKIEHTKSLSNILDNFGIDREIIKRNSTKNKKV